MNCKVSVIVPIYNVERYLDACVQSIVNQTYPNLEIILVDDGSPDRSGALCDAWAERDSRIRVIHKENSGVSDSRNAGMEIATGDWITFVDADDVVSAYLVEALLREQPREDSLHMVSYARFSEELPQDIAPQSCRILENNDFLSVRTSYFCWGALYSRELIQKAGLRFDTSLRLMEDEAWLAVYLLFVRRICFVQEPMYYYRQHPNSVTGAGLDRRKWVRAWFEMQESVLRWFAENDPDGIYKKESLLFYRHCQNKLIDDCVKGKLSYSEYRKCKVENSPQVNRLLVRYIPAEYVVFHYFSPIYFWLYAGMMKVRNKLVEIRRG